MARRPSPIPPFPIETPSDDDDETAAPATPVASRLPNPAGPGSARRGARAARESVGKPKRSGALGDSLAGQILIAMPAMTDPRFAQSVIYMCAHTSEGAMGLVINRPLAAPSFDDLLKQLKIDPVPPSRTIRLYAGGPVDNSRGFVLHTADWIAEASLRVDEGLALTASPDILKAIAEGGGPKDGFLALGYAGWGAGQLDREMSQNAWMNVPSDNALLFDPAYETKWRRAFAKLRIDPALLSDAVGHA